MRELIDGSGSTRVSEADDFITLDTRQLKENAFDSCILSPLTGTTDMGTTPRAAGTTPRSFNAEHFFSPNEPDYTYTISTRDDIDTNLDKRVAGAGKSHIDSTADMELRDLGGTHDSDLIDLRDSESPVMAPAPALSPNPAPAMCVITSENATKFGELEGVRDRMELLRQRLQESKTRESVLSPMSMSQSSMDFGVNGEISDLEEDSEGETTEKTANTQSAYELKYKWELEQEQERDLEQQLASTGQEPPETSTSPRTPEMKLLRPKVTRGVAFRLRKNHDNVEKGQLVERPTAQSEENTPSDKLSLGGLTLNSVEMAKEYQDILNPSYGAASKRSGMETIHSGDLSQDLSLEIEKEEFEKANGKGRSAAIYNDDLSQDLSRDPTLNLEEKVTETPIVKEVSAVETAGLFQEKQETQNDLSTELPQGERETETDTPKGNERSVENKPEFLQEKQEAQNNLSTELSQVDKKLDEESKIPKEDKKPYAESKLPQEDRKPYGKPKVGDEKLHIPISELMGRGGSNSDGTLDLFMDSEKERHLSQIQVLQSIILAEAASNSGASEFKTGDKSMFDLTRVKLTKEDIDGKKGSAGTPASNLQHRFKMFVSGTMRKNRSAASNTRRKSMI